MVMVAALGEEIGGDYRGGGRVGGVDGEFRGGW